MGYQDRFKDIEFLNIPAEQDRRGSDATVMSAFDDASEIRKAEREIQQFVELNDHNLERAGLSEAAGRMGTNAGGGAGADREARAKEEAKRRADALDRAQMMNLLDDHINGLDAQLAQYDVDIAEAEGALEAIDELEQLHKDGQLDPNNPEHAKLMRKAGITEKDVANDGAGAFSTARTRWQDRLGTLKAGRADVQKDRDHAGRMRTRLEKADTPAEIEAAKQEISDELQNGNANAARKTVLDAAADDLSLEDAGEIYSDAGYTEVEVEASVGALDGEDSWGSSSSDDIFGFDDSYESFAETLDESEAGDQSSATVEDEPIKPSGAGISPVDPSTVPTPT